MFELVSSPSCSESGSDDCDESDLESSDSDPFSFRSRRFRKTSCGYESPPERTDEFGPAMLEILQNAGREGQQLTRDCLLEQVSEALDLWEAQEDPPRSIFCLQHNYTLEELKLGMTALKGADCRAARLLISARELELHVGIALLTRTSFGNEQCRRPEVDISMSELLLFDAHHTVLPARPSFEETELLQEDDAFVGAEEEVVWVTGAGGAQTSVRTCHKGALVFWRESKHMDNLRHHGLAALLPFLERALNKAEARYARQQQQQQQQPKSLLTAGGRVAQEPASLFHDSVMQAIVLAKEVASFKEYGALVPLQRLAQMGHAWPLLDLLRADRDDIDDPLADDLACVLLSTPPSPDADARKAAQVQRAIAGMPPADAHRWLCRAANMLQQWLGIHWCGSMQEVSRKVAAQRRPPSLPTAALAAPVPRPGAQPTSCDRRACDGTASASECVASASHGAASGSDGTASATEGAAPVQKPTAEPSGCDQRATEGVASASEGAMPATVTEGTASAAEGVAPVTNGRPAASTGAAAASDSAVSAFDAKGATSAPDGAAAAARQRPVLTQCHQAAFNIAPAAGASPRKGEMAAAAAAVVDEQRDPAAAPTDGAAIDTSTARRHAAPEDGTHAASGVVHIGEHAACGAVPANCPEHDTAPAKEQPAARQHAKPVADLSSTSDATAGGDHVDPDALPRMRWYLCEQGAALLAAGFAAAPRTNPAVLATGKHAAWKAPDIAAALVVLAAMGHHDAVAQAAELLILGAGQKQLVIAVELLDDRLSPPAPPAPAAVAGHWPGGSSWPVGGHQLTGMARFLQFGPPARAALPPSALRVQPPIDQQQQQLQRELADRAAPSIAAVAAARGRIAASCVARAAASTVPLSLDWLTRLLQIAPDVIAVREVLRCCGRRHSDWHLPAPTLVALCERHGWAALGPDVAEFVTQLTAQDEVQGFNLVGAIHGVVVAAEEDARGTATAAGGAEVPIAGTPSVHMGAGYRTAGRDSTHTAMEADACTARRDVVRTLFEAAAQQLGKCRQAAAAAPPPPPSTGLLAVQPADSSFLQTVVWRCARADAAAALRTAVARFSNASASCYDLHTVRMPAALALIKALSTATASSTNGAAVHASTAAFGHTFAGGGAGMGMYGGGIGTHGALLGYGVLPRQPWGVDGTSDVSGGASVTPRTAALVAVGAGALAEACRVELAALARAEPPAVDYTLPYQIPAKTCSCAACVQINAFLRDPEQQKARLKVPSTHHFAVQKSMVQCSGVVLLRNANEPNILTLTKRPESRGERRKQHDAQAAKAAAIQRTLYDAVRSLPPHLRPPMAAEPAPPPAAAPQPSSWAVNKQTGKQQPQQQKQQQHQQHQQHKPQQYKPPPQQQVGRRGVPPPPRPPLAGLQAPRQQPQQQQRGLQGALGARPKGYVQQPPATGGLASQLLQSLKAKQQPQQPTDKRCGNLPVPAAKVPRLALNMPPKSDEEEMIELEGSDDE